MKNILITLIFLSLSPGLRAQGIYNNGGKIVIGSGAVVNITGIDGNYLNETNGSNGEIVLNGTLKLEGDYINNVVSSDIISSAGPGSEIAFTGTTNQIIGGTTSAEFNFNNLTINNGAGVTLNKNVKVNEVTTFTDGIIYVGANNFTFGPSASLSGVNSATSMIVASGSGEVRKLFNSAGTFTFPVGDTTAVPDYSPVTLEFTSGTFGTGAYASVKPVNIKYPDPEITGSYLNRYWDVAQSGISSFVCNVMFQYVPGDVVGTESDIFCLRVAPLPKETFDAANTTLHRLTASGLTSFGTFTGGIGSKTLNITLFLESLYNGAGLMRQAQGLSGNQFPGTTADQITIELHDPVTYSNLIHTISNVNLNTSGLATSQIPIAYNGSYYLTIRNRNSITTVSSIPVSFSSSVVNFNFSTSDTQAFGNNLKNVEPGVYAIFGGDANGDGVVDALDLIAVQNDVLLFSGGYLVTDLNGDGAVDALDLILASNNALLFISTINP